MDGWMGGGWDCPHFTKEETGSQGNVSKITVAKGQQLPNPRSL